MKQFTIEIRTVEGIGDSDLLDRLADLLYEREELVDPLLGLNDDGSISVGFGYAAQDVPKALDAVRVVAEALAASLPVDRHAATVERLSVAPADEREAVLTKQAEL
jgi:hypothetical protein